MGGFPKRERFKIKLSVIDNLFYAPLGSEVES